MTILVAPDKFKGSLTAAEAARAMRTGIHRYNPHLTVTEQPLADGGEGTADVLTKATGGQFIPVSVHDPLGQPIMSTFGLSGGGQTAFIEMAQASGLQLLRAGERNPWLTSTFGTGELIRAALNRGVETVVLCIGGSATNDGGIGLATALGYQFLDESGQALEPIGRNLANIHRIDTTNVLPQLRQVEFVVASDVDNPLTGPNGAAYVYAPQKGADSDMVQILDAGLERLSAVVQAQLDCDLADEPGSGAAGGTGYGARVFLNARLESGFSIVARYLNLEGLVHSADLILTGEGSLDEQTLSGKLVGGLTQLAAQYNKPVVAFCGRLALTPEQIRRVGLQQAVAITPASMAFADAVRLASTLLADATYQFCEDSQLL
ncbi:glycerate kinase [Spirosoma taeanense]|uniref:Glycerate kinase n=1 Tax=Spirosoma taeanense TaxID=2735870 RepID=A0A6M5YBY2_9BACT|nr:glycerate kinase [Spirosoma taeanense]QJW90816.1 glycerate kinase [Spirosoma taeanense]